MTVHSSGCVLLVYFLIDRMSRASGYILRYTQQILDFSTVTCRQFSKLTFAPRKTSCLFSSRSNLTLLRYHATAFITILYFSSVCKRKIKFFCNFFASFSLAYFSLLYKEETHSFTLCLTNFYSYHYRCLEVVFWLDP